MIKLGRVSQVLALLASPHMAMAEENASKPAMKRFVVTPHMQEIYSCEANRQIYFVQATIGRQSIPVVLLDSDGKEIPEGEFAVARSFRLDRAHENPVSVIFSCGY